MCNKNRLKYWNDVVQNCHHSSKIVPSKREKGKTDVRLMNRWSFSEKLKKFKFYARKSIARHMVCWVVATLNCYFVLVLKLGRLETTAAVLKASRQLDNHLALIMKQITRPINKRWSSSATRTNVCSGDSAQQTTRGVWQSYQESKSSFTWMSASQPVSYPARSLLPSFTFMLLWFGIPR